MARKPSVEWPGGNRQFLDSDFVAGRWPRPAPARFCFRPRVAAGRFAPVNWGLAPASLLPGSDPISPRSRQGEQRGATRLKTARGVRTSIATALFLARRSRNRSSAGFQPAVSPIPNRPRVRTIAGARSATVRRLEVLRPNRLEICATTPDNLRRLRKVLGAAVRGAGL